MDITSESSNDSQNSENIHDLSEYKRAKALIPSSKIGEDPSLKDVKIETKSDSPAETHPLILSSDNKVMEGQDSSISNHLGAQKNIEATMGGEQLSENLSALESAAFKEQQIAVASALDLKSLKIVDPLASESKAILAAKRLFTSIRDTFKTKAQEGGLSSLNEYPSLSQLLKEKSNSPNPFEKNGRLFHVSNTYGLEPKDGWLGRTGFTFNQKSHSGFTSLSTEQFEQFLSKYQASRLSFEDLKNAAKTEEGLIGNLKALENNPDAVEIRLANFHGGESYNKAWQRYHESIADLLNHRTSLNKQGLDTTEFDEQLEQDQLIGPFWAAKTDLTREDRVRSVNLYTQPLSPSADNPILRLFESLNQKKTPQQEPQSLSDPNPIQQCSLYQSPTKYKSISTYVDPNATLLYKLTDDSPLKNFDFDRFKPPQGKKLAHPDLPMMWAASELVHGNKFLSKVSPPEWMFIDEARAEHLANPSGAFSYMLAHVNEPWANRTFTSASSIQKKMDEIKQYTFSFNSPAYAAPTQEISIHEYSNYGIERSLHSEFFEPLQKKLDSHLDASKEIIQKQRDITTIMKVN